MYYTEKEARKLVIKAGKELLTKNLVARTWGNISARISADEFIITPSGKAYEALKEEDLVKVRISDGSFEEGKKPSSEKLLHGKCYKNREDVSFIIHTHQTFASALSVVKRDFPFARYVSYALPGTKKLAENVENAVVSNKADKVFLLSNHGALVLGVDKIESFMLVDDLEKKSKKEIVKSLGIEKIDLESVFALVKNIRVLPAYIDDFAQIFGPSINPRKGLEKIVKGKDSFAKKQILLKNIIAFLYGKQNSASSMGYFDACIQNLVYKLKYSKLKDK